MNLEDRIADLEHRAAVMNDNLYALSRTLDRLQGITDDLRYELESVEALAKQNSAEIRDLQYRR